MEGATPVNGQRTTDNGLAIRSDGADDDNGKAALTTVNGQRKAALTTVNSQQSTDNRLPSGVMLLTMTTDNGKATLTTDNRQRTTDDHPE